MAAVEAALAERTRTPSRPVAVVPRQLPPAADLVGRGDLAAEVSWLLRRESRPAAPVVVISGAAGIGKTALALRAAHSSSDRYPDGQLYLEMRRSTAGAPGAPGAPGAGGAPGAHIDTGEVLAQFLRALGVPRVPEAVAERLATYRTWLAIRRITGRDSVEREAACCWQRRRLLCRGGIAGLVTGPPSSPPRRRFRVRAGARSSVGAVSR